MRAFRKESTPKEQPPSLDQLFTAITNAKYAELVGFATLLTMISKKYNDVPLGAMEAKDWVAFIHEAADMFCNSEAMEQITNGNAVVLLDSSHNAVTTVPETTKR